MDASWADCPFTRWSVTGYVIYLNGRPICWCTQKQSLVALSSLEAEYYAASKCIGELMDLLHTLSELSGILSLKGNEMTASEQHRECGDLYKHRRRGLTSELLRNMKETLNCTLS